MNVLGVIDEKGEVTRVALEAQIALEDGDTIRSAQLFRRAGEMLESSVAKLTKPSERDLARFVAATHYYKGAAYPDAARVCDRIQGRRLPARVRHLYPPFLGNVRERTAPGYAERYTEEIRELYGRVTAGGDGTAAQRVIDLLIAHPYLFPRDRMAYMRARCCDVLGHRRAATLFYRDAWRFEPGNPHYLLAYLDSLCQEGKHEEAWAIVEDRLEEHPGAISSIGAMSVINAILERDRHADPPADEPMRRGRRDDLLKHFDSALESCRSMTPGERRALAPLIDRAFLITWVPYGEVNGVDGQRALIDRWVELNPDSPHARALREIIASPGGASSRDGRDGIQRAEHYVNEYSMKPFEAASPILDASLV